MAWLSLILAGCCEIVGVAMMHKLNERRSFKWLLLLALSFIASFTLLNVAMQTLPMSTAYAIWTGIGASGGALLGMLVYGEARSVLRIVCITLILGSAVGLKLLS